MPKERVLRRRQGASSGAAGAPTFMRYRRTTTMAMHLRVPTRVYDCEVEDVFFDSPAAAGVAQSAALRRARSSGMVRRAPDGGRSAALDNAQYLYTRHKSIAQNEPRMLQPGASEGQYASNTPCFGGEGGRHVVHHHVGNAQFNTQGGVTGAEMAWRRRYNATLGPATVDTPFGQLQQANNLAFVNGARIFDLKARIGAPYPCHPRRPGEACGPAPHGAFAPAGGYY